VATPSWFEISMSAFDVKLFPPDIERHLFCASMVQSPLPITNFCTSLVPS
jgi:hypothetical protein